jgi:hypothetical protein
MNGPWMHHEFNKIDEYVATHHHRTPGDPKFLASILSTTTYLLERRM